MNNKGWFFVLLSSILASCSVGPDYKQPQFFSSSDLQRSLHLSDQNQNLMVDLEWYKSFDDVVLNHLVARGLNESPNVETAIAKLRQARQNLRINAVKFMPQIDAAGSYHKAQNPVSYGVPLTNAYYQTGLDASWEIDIWGGGRRLSESSAALLKAAVANLQNVQLSLTAEIATDYVTLRQYQKQLSIARRNLKLQQDIFTQVKDKHHAGLADDLSFNQARYLVENTRSSIPELEKNVSAYQNSLSVLVGQLPENYETLLSENANDLLSKTQPLDITSIYNLPLSVVRKRPDVQVAEQQLIAQNAQIGVAIAQLYPSVNLTGFLGWQAASLGHLITPHTDMYSLSPAINLPLFHFGALVNNVELQKYLTQEQLAQYKSTLLNAALEIRNSMVGLEKESARTASAAQALSAQQQVADLTLIKYKQGLIAFSEVLEAQQNLLTAQNTYITANAEVYREVVAFYKAVGGGYNPNNQYCSYPKGCCR